MKKIKIGILLGIIAGIIDVIPMIIQKLTWDANISAISMWIVIDSYYHHRFKDEFHNKRNSYLISGFITICHTDWLETTIRIDSNCLNDIHSWRDYLVFNP
jgi:hypothetical protein